VTYANYSRELFVRIIRANSSRIHTDASDQVARQNTLTSFLTFIIDSVYRFIVFIDLVMLFRQKSYRLGLRILKRSKRSLKLSCHRFGGRNENLFVISIKQSKAEKRRRPKPLRLSNVHNIIMKLKNVLSKLSTELLLPIPVNELFMSYISSWFV